MHDDPNKSKPTTPGGHDSWFKKLIQAISREPQTKTELIAMLRAGAKRQLIDRYTLNMIEGVLEVHELKVRDVMIPRSQMITIQSNMALEELINTVVTSGHSRFPAIGENKDDVLGIVLAKDLLPFAFNSKKINLKDILRNAEFIPEGKRLDSLLQEFRIKRNHIAIVVDEYGGVTGLITIEDVIEQIVGEIADEHDIVESPFIRKRVDNTYDVKALTSLDEFNEYFSTSFEEKDIETIGGLVLKKFGRLPSKGEIIDIDAFTFKVLRADSRKIILLQVVQKKIQDS